MKVVLFIFLCEIFSSEQKKQPTEIKIHEPNQKFGNPAFVKDRFEKVIIKPELPTAWIDQYRLPFHPAWMDYCDPYHCNDYHKPACGLNRKTMRFKWFQSGCHIILNNQCSTYRGFLKYDWVDTKYCTAYVMFARSRTCPAYCDEESTTPVCGISVMDKHVALFENECAMEKANCKLESLKEYEVMDPEICLAYVLNLPDTIKISREGPDCPPKCNSDSSKHVCAIHEKEGTIVRFKNACVLKTYNCKQWSKNAYREANMATCIIAEILGLTSYID